MGLFSKKRSQEKEQLKQILLTTTFDIPGKKYVILGTIFAEVSKAGSANLFHVANQLIAKARQMDADAIIGFQGTCFHNSINWVSQSGYGTVVKFVSIEDDTAKLSDSFKEIEIEDIQDESPAE